ncbi:MAG: hypothetical protein ACREIT_07955 [Tepidisphaeraceae bacterium]
MSEGSVHMPEQPKPALAVIRLAIIAGAGVMILLGALALAALLPIPPVVGYFLLAAGVLDLIMGLFILRRLGRG